MNVIPAAFGGPRCPIAHAPAAAAAEADKDPVGAAPQGLLDLEQTHRDLSALAAAASEAEPDPFADAFRELSAYAALRFAEEEAVMAQLNDPLAAAHRRQHAWLLRDLDAFAPKIEAGRQRAARAFLRHGLSKWLLIHAASMDAPLALSAHLGDAVRRV
ncbi:MAG: hemerythrin family protein [Pseudomonadota bacterium]